MYDLIIGMPFLGQLEIYTGNCSTPEMWGLEFTFKFDI